MKLFSLTLVALATTAIAAPAFAKPAQPPMNSFNFAFYTCDNGNAFQISYDSDTPSQATLTTSNNNKQYQLKRTDVSNGIQFSNQDVRFWTDGKDTVITGTGIPLNNCKMKTSAS